MLCHNMKEVNTDENSRDRRLDWPVAIFSSHAEADAADEAQYKAMTPAQRLEIMFELHNRYYGEYPERLAGVH